MSRSMTGTGTGLLAVALGIALAGPGLAAEKPEGKGTVIGRVVDREGRPVAGAEVWVGDRARGAVWGRTDSDGRFRLGSLSADQPAIVWTEDAAKGLAREHFDGVRVDAGRETDVGVLVLPPGARVLGRVVGEDGRPVAGVEATITSYRHVLGHTITANGPTWTVDGDDQGLFQTAALPVGSAQMVIRAPGKARQFLSRLIEPGQSAVDLDDITLKDESPITGVVVDQDGRPIAGAKVVVDADHEHPAIADRDGRFVVHDAATDASWFQVQATGYFDPGDDSIHLLKGRRTDLRVPLQKAYTIAGAVVDAETGKPVDFERVQLCTVVRDEDAHVTLVG